MKVSQNLGIPQLMDSLLREFPDWGIPWLENSPIWEFPDSGESLNWGIPQLGNSPILLNNRETSGKNTFGVVLKQIERPCDQISQGIRPCCCDCRDC